MYMSQSYQSIDLYNPSTDKSIEIPDMSHTHTIIHRNQRALSGNSTDHDAFSLSLSHLKMRRKSCECQECGALSKLQFRFMNVPMIQKPKKLSKQITMRKQKFQIAGTTIKALQALSMTTRRKSTQRLSIFAPRTPSPNFVGSSLKVIDFQPLDLKERKPVNPSIIPFNTDKRLESSKNIRHYAGPHFIIKVNGIKIDELGGGKHKDEHIQQNQLYHAHKAYRKPVRQVKNVYLESSVGSLSNRSFPQLQNRIKTLH